VLPCLPAAMPDQDAAASPPGGVLVQHRVNGFSDEWLIGEEPVPEGVWHDHAVELLKALLQHWITRTVRDAAVFRNLAVRIRPDKPQIGFDPDLQVVEPAPPGARELSSLRLWQPGHARPSLVIEVVSPGHPYKDYSDIPDRCAALAVRELVVFDPMLVGPKAFGGPHRLQGWRRTDAGTFERTTAGDGPVQSDVLGAYFVLAHHGHLLRIADDEAGERPWLTGEESARVVAEHARAAEELARADTEDARAAEELARAEAEDARAAEKRALERVSELEAELARRGR
jgi:Uma2 family endonuclease